MVGSLTVIYSSDGTLWSIIKTGSPLEESLFKECIQKAKERASEVVALITKATSREEK